MLEIPRAGTEKPEHHSALFTNHPLRSMIMDCSVALLKVLSAEDPAACKAFCLDLGPIFWNGFVDPFQGDGAVPRDAGAPGHQSPLMVALSFLLECLNFFADAELDAFLRACLMKDSECPADTVAQSFEVCWTLSLVLFFPSSHFSSQGAITKLFNEKMNKEAETVCKMLSVLSPMLPKETHPKHCQLIQRICAGSFSFPSLSFSFTSVPTVKDDEPSKSATSQLVSVLLRLCEQTSPQTV